MHLLFTTVQISQPSIRHVPARHSTWTKTDAFHSDGDFTRDSSAEAHSRVPEQFPNSDLADPDCADWT